MVEFLFYLFGSVALGSALGVVLSRNPVGSLIFMVATLASVAGIYVLLEAHFLAAIQIMVYAGAIMVLFMFVIMLLNLGHDAQRDIKTGLGAILAFAVSGMIAGGIARTLGGAASDTALQYFQGPQALDLAIEEQGILGVIAHPLYTEYVVAFEVTGLLLLVAIVGALALAKRRVSS
jgi:NADH-quinone oxidoreductase subunit J